MQTYLANLQNNLSLVLPIITLLAILISCILVGLIMMRQGRSKFQRLKSTLETENTAKEQKNSQLNEEISHAQQKIQQLETQLNDKKSHIEQMQEKQEQTIKEQGKQVLKLETHIKQRNQQLNELLDNLGQNLALEKQQETVTNDIYADALWQRQNDVISELTTRLINDAQIQAELQQHNETTMASLTEKEATTQKLEQALNEQTKQISQLEQDVNKQKFIAEQLQDKEKKLLEENLSHIEQLEQEKNEAFEKVNLTEQTIRQLQQELDDKNSQLKLLEVNQQKIPLLEEELNQKTREIERIYVEKQKLNQNLEEVQALKAQIKQYNSQFSQNLKTLAENFNLILEIDESLSLWQQHDNLMSQLSQNLNSKQEKEIVVPENILLTSENSAQIKQLQETIDGQKNHIARLEDELNEKKLMLQDKQKSIPATILARQEADEARIAELEQALATAEKAQHLPDDVKQGLEQRLFNPVKEQLHDLTENAQKIPHKAVENLNQQWLNPAKEQIDATTEKVKHLPEKLKGFFSHKLASLKKS